MPEGVTVPDDLTRRLDAQDAAGVRADASDIRQDAAAGRADVSDGRQDAQDVRADASDSRQDAADARADASDIRQDSAGRQARRHDEVQAQQTAEGFLHAEERSVAQQADTDYVATRVQSLVVASAFILLCLGIVLTAVLIAARSAQSGAKSALDSAKRADFAGGCATLLLGSVAGRSINPAAAERGCDTAPAQELIDLGLERDRMVHVSRVESQARLCAFAALLDVPPQDPAVLAFRKDLGCVS